MEQDVVDYSIYALLEIREMISNLEDNPPKDKRKKEYRDYIDKLNNLFQLYNSKVNEKVYKIIK